MNNSARRTIEILELLADSEEGITLSEISKLLGIPKTRVFDILDVLVSKNFARIDDPKLKTYALGFSAYKVGITYYNRTDLFPTARPELINLMKKVGETIYLAVEDEGKVVYIDKVESNAPIRSTCKIGSKNYMHLTGLGKAILASYSYEKIEALIGNKFVSRTPATLTTLDDLYTDLVNTRKRGYAIDNGEDNEFVKCIAAPILGMNGKTIAAISISMLSSNFCGEHLELCVKLLCETALHISSQMGYTGTALYTT